jgi:glucose-6-phosphate 1-dehydrogenase
MISEARAHGRISAPSGDPCILVIFGASGDLTKRLLMPALYNLICDARLSERFVIVGMAMADLNTESFREKLTADVQTFCTRKDFDRTLWDDLARRMYYLPGQFDEPAAYDRLSELLKKLDDEYQTGGNFLFYQATPPAFFGVIAENLGKSGLALPQTGWRRLIVEKPFGHDLASAVELNRVLLRHFNENQIFRIDHYLGKETVQNLLAFRFSNGMFEPLWNKQQIDHIQFTVAESVGVEERGRYYDGAGALRDVVQNHMFQMLAYLCMEPPSSFRADAVRNEKAKVLDAVRIMSPEQVLKNTVRGQYGPGRKPDGTVVPGYRQEKNVDPNSTTETFAALKLFIDNWRWEGVPIFLRSGKSLWKRGTEILVQFKKAPEVIFRDTPEIDHLENNQLIFHVQPDQGIEVRFQAKSPGPAMSLQKVNMRFDYQDSFEASRGTGYEVLLYHCMLGDATLFARDDLVEAAWRIAQPILDTWANNPPTDFPNYNAGSWGPKASFHLIERDGRKWLEVINRAVLERVPLFQDTSSVFLHGLALVLKPIVFAAGDYVVKKGDPGSEMYFIARGYVDVVDQEGQVLRVLGEGNFFGERSLITSAPRSAHVRARTQCDLFVLEKSDFVKVLKDHPKFARSILETSKRLYQLSPDAEEALAAQIVRHLRGDD